MSSSAGAALTHLVPLAQEVDKNKVTPGVLGFIVFAVMALAVWGLMKSMNRHMAKVDFKEAPEGGEQPPASPASPGAGSAGSPASRSSASAARASSASSSAS